MDTTDRALLTFNFVCVWIVIFLLAFMVGDHTREDHFTAHQVEQHAPAP